VDRAEKIGLGVALVGHAVLFGLLSLGFLSTPNPLKLKQQPIDVSLVDAVAVEAEAPVIQTEAPAQSKAPEEGPAEQAAPPETAPDPVPAPEPEPEPAPPVPVPPRPAPPKPATRPAPKPAPAPKPVPQPVPKPRPQPAAAQPIRAKPTPPRAVPATQPKTNAARPTAQPKPAPNVRPVPAGPAPGRPRPDTGNLDKIFEKGFGRDPAPPNARPVPPARKIGQMEAANIASAIIRQVQPCANRQVTPGPGAERIRVDLNLRINRDGSLAARPVVRGHQGVDEGNQRYVARVDDLAIATFVGCAPLKGLPPELYDVPGGWSNFTLRYKLPG
jgi:hypothetical protein